jgi:hypothetical protein
VAALFNKLIKKPMKCGCCSSCEPKPKKDEPKKVKKTAKKKK